MKRKGKRLVAMLSSIAMAASLFAGCGASSSSSSNGGAASKDSDGLTEVSFVTPTALASMDVVWLYAADEMGFLKEEGIKLNYIECTDGSDPMILASGQAQFGGFSSAVGLSAADSGVTNIEAITNILSVNHFGIAYNKESGIKDWKDLEGKNIGALADTFAGLYNPILQAAGVDTSKVNYVTYGSSEYEALNTNQVPAMGTWLSEYYMCQGMGYDWGYLSGNDVQPCIANSLWVNTDFAKENPDIVKGFARAVEKAIYLCYLNPEAVADITLTKYPSIEISWDGAVGSVKGNVAAMLGIDEADQKAKVDSKEIGKFDMDVCQTTIDNLYKGGSIKNELKAEDYYTNDYFSNDWDYSEVEKASDSYEFQSKVYKEANK